MRITLMISLLLLNSGVFAEEGNGKKLHQSHCIACHAGQFGNNGNDIYTRPNRRVTNYPALTRQVNRCQQVLSLTWFDDEIEDVTNYLNHSYYHFAPPQ